METVQTVTFAWRKHLTRQLLAPKATQYIPLKIYLVNHKLSAASNTLSSPNIGRFGRIFCESDEEEKKSSHENRFYSWFCLNVNQFDCDIWLKGCKSYDWNAQKDTKHAQQPSNRIEKILTSKIRVEFIVSRKFDCAFSSSVGFFYSFVSLSSAIHSLFCSSHSLSLFHFDIVCDGCCWYKII